MAIVTLLYHLGIIKPTLPRRKTPTRDRLARPIRDALDAGTLPDAQFQVILQTEQRRRRKQEERDHKAVTQAEWLYFCYDVMICLGILLFLLGVVHWRTLEKQKESKDGPNKVQRKGTLDLQQMAPLRTPTPIPTPWQVTRAGSLVSMLIAGLFAMGGLVGRRS